ncbi:MAG: DUF2203 domain-containing protein [Pirellulaceae bacterium]
MVHAIGNENGASSDPRKVFTPAAATRMLPLVRRIVVDILRLNHSIKSQREQLGGINSLPETNEHASYRDELTDMRQSLSNDETELSACIAELSALGISVHRPIDGSVDFPAVVNRQPVQLCWRPDEEVVCHWHETQSPHGKRHKIDSQISGVESLR